MSQVQFRSRAAAITVVGFACWSSGYLDQRSVQMLCLIPEFDGAIFSRAWKDALWAKFFTAAPRQQRRFVER